MNNWALALTKTGLIKLEGGMSKYLVNGRDIYLALMELEKKTKTLLIEVCCGKTLRAV